ncbi:hypothetical protein SMSP2_00958 [Limihaloglobus sulfuriphilus]|uniref:Uncharacterized protein n=1 Tax=Limihaloglobus sulfuriphilus TaxID=1851148 RepID=A0A1Q2MD77_9BACT|nr:GxGYxYP domain-containing protein [Limihaloglobus sulfuriphilus]AQQ70604.1 hypothetical protein SMSP2_00958 [Limihaloglobus sulfuriphilus]
MKLLIKLFAFCSLIIFSGFSAAETPKIAVLVEKDMINFAGQPTLLPHRIKDILAEYGIDSVEIDVQKMADKSYFNTDNFTIIILAYGNAFPLTGYENLRDFHTNGGCLVVNGIPFTHPAEKKRNTWHDLGHIDYVHHDKKGMGTGNFGDPATAINELRIAENNPLGLKTHTLPKINQWVQHLRVDTLAKEDEVIPIVETRLGAEKWAPATAIIKHECPMFKGAMTLWLGQTANQLHEKDYYFLRQTLARGAAYMLREKSHISEDQYKAVLTKVDGEDAPSQSENNLTPYKEPRPWGNTFLPKSKKPAEHILAVDIDTLRADERIALACLQGLTSRERPQIWLSLSEENGDFWLDVHKKKGYIDSFEYVKDWKSLFKKFSASFKGGIIPDDKLYRGNIIAANAAACEDFIIVNELIAEELNIDIKMDLRGKFETYAEGMSWVWNNYSDQLSRHLCDVIHESRFQNTAFAYDIQWKALMFWIAGPKDAVLPGADPIAETQVMERIFAETAPNTAMLGFPWNGEGVGLGEVGGTSFCGGFGKSLVCTDHLPNLCITSGVVTGPLKQRKQPPAPKLENDKIYISLVCSDGDNQNLWLTYFKNYVEDKHYGDFPFSFGMGPAIYDLQPAVAQWYYENAAPTTEFISDVSGIGYMRPDDYALRFADKTGVYEGFLDWTGKYLKLTDMKTLRTVGGGDESLRTYINHLDFMHSVFADMGRYSGFSGYENLTYTLDNMPVFRCHTTWDKGPKGFIEDVRQQVGDHRPAFVNAMAHCWTLESISIAKRDFVDQMDEDMVLVTPSQLADLYSQHKQSDAVKE